jgi:hypothetical protein
MTNFYKKGLSLIEITLYLATISIILPTIIYFFIFSVRLMISNQLINHVDQQASQTLQVVTQIIRNADRVNWPLLGDSSSSLSVVVFNDSSTSTLLIELDSGKIKLTEGINSQFLSNSQIGISGLLFSNIARGGTKGSIKIQLTAASSTYSKIFYSSASLRNH